MNESAKEMKRRVLEGNPLFAPLEPLILDTISTDGEIVHLDPGELIISQDDTVREEFYIVIDGELEAFKKDEQGRCYSLNQIKPGDVFGESVILGEKQRASSVRALMPAEVFVIPNRLIEQFAGRYPLSVNEFGKVLHKQTVNYLHKINARATELINTQKNINFFLINIVVFLSLFAIFVPSLEHAIKNVYPTLITTPLVFLGSILVFLRLRALNLPLSVVGVTTQNLKKTIIESVTISLVMLLAIVLIKFILIHTVKAFSTQPLFLTAYTRYQMRTGTPMSTLMYIFSILFYATHAIFQEIIARGSIQGIFSQVFPENKKYYSIILASLVFASAHAYFGIGYVLVVFLPGLFWGWLFYKQQNIFGAIISHIIIGIGMLKFIGWAGIPP